VPHQDTIEGAITYKKPFLHSK